MLGDLPALMIDLVKEGVLETNKPHYPTLTLYENDLVIEKVRAYTELHPLSDFNMVNLIELIIYKIEYFS